MKKIIYMLLFITFYTYATNDISINLNSYKYIIPAYRWSYELNNQLKNIKDKAIIILNPNNWNFNKREEIFEDLIKKSTWHLVIWYVYTSYGNRSLKEVYKNIINYKRYYPEIKWFFIDEVSNDISKYKYYKSIYNFIKRINPKNIVVLNPWTNISEKYINISDNIVIYEETCQNYIWYNIPNWILKYPSYKFSFLWHSCDDIEYYDNLFSWYIRYFTKDWYDWNPWDSLEYYYIK